jgi:3-oxoadipate enol-lactonase
MSSSLMRGFCYIAAVALVFLHGLGTGPEAWEPQLAALGSGRQAIAPRLLLDGGFTIEREADRILRELLTEPLDLCGLSLGALVALRMALDEPDRVRRLVLCAGFASLPLRFRVLQAAVGTIAAVTSTRRRSAQSSGRGAASTSLPSSGA